MSDRKKILLYYPLLNESKEERDYHWFPYSVLPLAQSLSRYGYEPIIIDHRVENNISRHLGERSKEILFVGISTMSGYQIKDGLIIAENVRKISPDIPIIWGGWHPTILPEETAESPLVDIAVAGRGEDTIIEIAESLALGKGFEQIKGIAYKKGRMAVFTGYKEPTKMKDDAQQYDKFIPIESYINPKTMALGYFSAHGCAFNCAFCSRHFMTNRYTPYPLETVMANLQYFIRKYHFKHVHFQDDEFFIDVRRVYQLAEELIASRIKVTWWANMRSNFIYKLSEKEIKLLVESGLTSVFIGVESASQELLDTMNKGTSSDDIVRTVEVLSKYDICPNLSYMFGVPGDDVDKLRLTINQIKLLKQMNEKITAQTCFYQPYPGTALYQVALDWGFPQLRGLEAWGNLRPQSEPYKIPWLSQAEMSVYEKEFYSFFNGK
jgi:anaerobic magnesium-protoporphyrin IX monomethyl ester cyclase